MRFNVIVNNPTIMKQENGLYTVIYAELPEGKIEKKENLTYEDAAALPYVQEFMLQLVK